MNILLKGQKAMSILEIRYRAYVFSSSQIMCDYASMIWFLNSQGLRSEFTVLTKRLASYSIYGSHVTGDFVYETWFSMI